MILAGLLGVSGLAGATHLLGSPAAHPEGALASVTILPDGSVSTAGVLSVSGDTYTLEANFTGAIADERNDSVLDGANFTVVSAGYPAGVTVLGATEVRVDSFVVSSTHGGIAVENSSSVVVSDNSVTASLDAIDINTSSAVTVDQDRGSGAVGVSGVGDSGLDVHDNSFPDAGDLGTDVGASNGVSFHGNDFADAGSTGAYLSEDSGVTILDNDLNGTGTGTGLSLEGVSAVNASSDFALDQENPFVLEGVYDAALWNDSASPSAQSDVFAEDCVDLTIGSMDVPSPSVYGVYALADDNLTLVRDSFANSGIGIESQDGVGLTILNSNLGSDNTGAYLVSTSNVSVRDSNLGDANTGVFAEASTDVGVVDSNLTRANFPVSVADGSYGVVVDGSNLDSAQIGGVLVANSSDVTVENSTLRGDAEFAVEATFSAGVTVVGSNVSGTAAAPGLEGVVTVNDTGVDLEHDSINWTETPVTDTGSRNFRVANSSLTNATFGTAVLSLDDDEDVDVIHSNLSGADGAGITADGVLALTVTDCQLEDLEEDGVAVQDTSGLTVTGSDFDGDGNVAIYAADSAGIVASNDSANGTFVGVFANGDASVAVTNTTSNNDGSGGVEADDVIGLTLAGDNFSADGSGTISVSLDAVPEFAIVGTTFWNDSLGAQVEGSSAGTMVGNEFLNDSVSVWLEGPTIVLLDHNDFVADAGWDLDEPGTVTWNASYPVGGNYWSNYTGGDAFHGPGQNLSGADGIGDTPMVLNATIEDHYPLMVPWARHTLVFLETGLPSGSRWGVEVNGTVTSTTTNSIVEPPASGTEWSYSYTVPSVAGFTVSPASGSGTIGARGDGSNVVPLTFTAVVPPTFPVEFAETGLMSGASWSFSFAGTEETTTNSTIRIEVPNGTYGFTVTPIAGETITPRTGSVAVDGSPVLENISFLPTLYQVTVVEQGDLPAGTPWSVTIEGTPEQSTTSNLTVELPNGSYDLVVGGITGYVVAPASATFTVAGGFTTVYLEYLTVPGTATPPPPVPNLTPAQGSDLLWGIIVGLAIVAVLGWVVAFRKSRGGAPAGPPPPTAGGPSEPPGPPPPG
jgi:hypothetical protein